VTIDPNQGNTNVGLMATKGRSLELSKDLHDNEGQKINGGVDAEKKKIKCLIHSTKKVAHNVYIWEGVRGFKDGQINSKPENSSYGGGLRTKRAKRKVVSTNIEKNICCGTECNIGIAEKNPNDRTNRNKNTIPDTA